MIDLASPPAGVRTARIAGQGQEEHWGAALQIGDLNNDGIGDIIIGGSIFRDSGSYVTPNDQDSGHNNFGASLPGRPGCGAAYVIYGQQKLAGEYRFAHAARQSQLTSSALTRLTCSARRSTAEI